MTIVIARNKPSNGTVTHEWFAELYEDATTRHNNNDCHQQNKSESAVIAVSHSVTWLQESKSVSCPVLLYRHLTVCAELCHSDCIIQTMCCFP